MRYSIVPRDMTKDKQTLISDSSKSKSETTTRQNLR